MTAPHNQSGVSMDRRTFLKAMAAAGFGAAAVGTLASCATDNEPATKPSSAAYSELPSASNTVNAAPF